MRFARVLGDFAGLELGRELPIARHRGLRVKTLGRAPEI
jgi:hypothetical protein